MPDDTLKERISVIHKMIYKIMKSVKYTPGLTYKELVLKTANSCRTFKASIEMIQSVIDGLVKE